MAGVAHGPLFPLVLHRQVVADDAAGGGAQQRMVVGQVARDTADHSALDAAFGLGGAGGSQGHGDDKREGFHRDFPFE